MSFPDDWSYRRKITISGSFGAGTGYQVLFKIGESSGSSDYDFHLDNKSTKFPSQQDDGGDLRFSLDDGTTLLPFWVEKVEGTTPYRTAYVWVKVNADLSTDQNIYIYFGNANADNVSSADDTFEFFDEFEDASSCKFEHLRGDGAYGFENSMLYIRGASDGNTVFQSPLLNLPNNILIQAKVYAYDWNEMVGIGISKETDLGTSAKTDGIIKNGYNWGWWGWSGDAHALRTIENSSFTNYDHGAYEGFFSAQNYHYYYIGGSYDGYTLRHFKPTEDGIIVVDRERTDTAFSNDFWKRLIIHVWSGAKWGFDRILVRKYSDPEPVFSSVDNIESLSTLQGIVCDKNGNPITGTSVKIFLLDKDTGELLETTTSNSEDGSWSADFWSTSPKTLAVFALEGTYGEDTDIAGAEFLEVE